MDQIFASLPWLAAVFLVAGFFPLIWGADKLVEGGAALANRLRVPPLVIGLTIVAFGTSAPELVVNMFSAASGNTDLALGNIVGSNLFNLLAILGLSAILYPLTVRTSTTWSEIPLVILSSLLILAMALDGFLGDAVTPEGNAMIGRVDGLVLLSFFVLFLVYTFGLMKKGEGLEDLEIKDETLFQSIFYIVAGLGLLILGGKIIVDSAVSLARTLGIAERVIGLTIVAAGTSLPELATSVTAAIKKKPDIAVGNVVGSNIFNVFFILGLTAVVSPVPIQGPEISDLVMNVVASLLLFAFLFMGKKHQLGRWEGILFVSGFIGYLTWLLAFQSA